jgi:hypothetical protein
MEIGIAQLMPSVAYDKLSDAQIYADESARAVAADELDAERAKRARVG